ncbi:MAG TPA: hypothetical protein PK514_02515 [Spirochaetota bacterium]|nr:hypothetical protein [Spirochaetota bacterium]
MIHKIFSSLLSSLMIIFILYSASAAAEQEDIKAVKTFEDSITVKALLVAPIRGLRIQIDKTAYDSEYFEYTANTVGAFGIDISFRDFNFRFTSGTFFNSFEDENGKTDY